MGLHSWKFLHQLLDFKSSSWLPKDLPKWAKDNATELYQDKFANRGDIYTDFGIWIGFLRSFGWPSNGLQNRCCNVAGSRMARLYLQPLGAHSYLVAWILALLEVAGARYHRGIRKFIDKLEKLEHLGHGLRPRQGNEGTGIVLSSNHLRLFSDMDPRPNHDLSLEAKRFHGMVCSQLLACNPANRNILFRHDEVGCERLHTGFRELFHLRVQGDTDVVELRSGVQGNQSEPCV
mmetsp:Transcript_27622/g.64840  ORF Transcript_27622/g.64840 Transcript_27622/m.64840 type:complete len:234 (+) Transcript_27622:1393-2094(+)